jgi:hypothetical protein
VAKLDQNDWMSPGSREEPRSIFPWIIAGVVVALVIISLLLIGRQPPPPTPPNPGGAALAPAAAYAPHLAITDVKMSESSTISGASQTYIDGNITNNGTATLTGITVQVAFNDFTGKIGQKNTMPLALIRARQPYIDVEPVSANPIGPGQTREFRLIFDHVTEAWNQQYPEIRVIAVQTK